MSGDALTPAEVEVELRRLDKNRAPDDFRPLAMLGTGPAAKITVDGADWEIVPVRGELDLRRALVEREGQHTFTVYLVDFAEQLPLDVTCRLRSNTLHRVTLTRRLASRFGARGVSPGLAQSAVARHLLSLPDGQITPVSHPTLTADDLWEAALAGLLDVAPPREARDWLVLVARGVGAAQLAALVQASPGLGEELEAWLSRDESLGAAGGVLVRAWVANRGVELLSWLVLSQAAAKVGLLDHLHVLAVAIFDKALPEAEARLLPVLDAVLEALRKDHPELLAAVCKAAEDRPQGKLVALTRASRWLRGGYESLREELAAELDLCAEAPEQLGRVWELVEDISRHHYHLRSDEDALFAARLVTWCAWRAAVPLKEEVGAWSDLIAVADAYQRDGGHVDWCRGHLRERVRGADALSVAIRRLVARADALRDADDERFAAGLVAWHEARRPVEKVLPLHMVSREVIKPFLAAAPARRVLVVLMDGLSRANLVRLLPSLDGWQPLREQTPRPVLASLPTLTGISRSAFFAGKEAASHAPGLEGDDSKRWAQNADLRDFAGLKGPQLVEKQDLKAELSALGGLLASEDRVAAVIVNVADDDLSGAPQLDAGITAANVPVLGAILKLAAFHRRVVLLVADHGHVVGSRVVGRKALPGTEGGQRYRTLGPSEAPLPEELELPASVWRPKGASRVAAFWREDTMWGITKKGAHGGLTLAEVVVPCVMVAPTWLAVDEHDAGLQTVEVAPPRWWMGTRPPVARRVVRVEAEQVGLFGALGGGGAAAELGASGAPAGGSGSPTAWSASGASSGAVGSGTGSGASGSGSGLGASARASGSGLGGSPGASGTNLGASASGASSGADGSGLATASGAAAPTGAGMSAAVAPTGGPMGTSGVGGSGAGALTVGGTSAVAPTGAGISPAMGAGTAPGVGSLTSAAPAGSSGGVTGASAAARGAASAARHPLVEAFSKNPLFAEISKSRGKEEVDDLLRVLDVLLAAPRPGVLPMERFADAMGRSSRRAHSLVLKSQFFQLDGVTLLESDQGTGLVTLHVDLWRRQFGLG